LGNQQTQLPSANRSEPALSASSVRLAELDAMRGVAAIIVMLFHYTWRGGEMLPALQMIPWSFHHAHYGVELFFGISGFVILMTLERTASAADFVVSRFARLFPTYWFAVALTTLGLIVLDMPSLLLPKLEVLANFTMLQEYFYLRSVDGVYWSLSVELGFYFCMLVLWRVHWLNHIERVLLLWITMKLIYPAVPRLPSLAEAVLVVRYIPWFAIGMVAYRVRCGARTWGQQLPVLLLGLAICTYLDGWADGLVFVSVTAIFALLIAGRLSWLSHPVLLWLGALSYPFYLIHQYLGYAVMLTLERFGAPVWVAFALTVAAALGTAHFIHRLIEAPGLSIVRGWWKNRRTAATA
jgi:peptidoglycan/LPS O-acetylase OafA/YrhL